MKGDLPVVWPLLVFVIGACIGSFLNVVIYRLPRGQSLVAPRSACPGCARQLGWWENIPIVSYLLLRGRCHTCKMRISLRYPAVEALSGIMAVALWYRFGPGLPFVVYAGFAFALVAVTFIDLDHQIIPDVITLPGIGLGILCSFLLPTLSWETSVLGVLVGGGVLWAVAWAYYLLTRREGLGGGDIKLLAMIGAFLGWRAVPTVIFVSALVGSVVGLAAMVWQRGGRNMRIPYGPFLSFAAIIALLWGADLLKWYIDLLSLE